MSMLLAALGASGSAGGKLYVEDVFSTFLYTGNGSTQTINNGVDLAGKGGLVWTKPRSQAYSHGLYDSLRGPGKYLASQVTDAQTTAASTLTSFNSNGFSVGSDNGAATINTNGFTYASWTFRRAAKFFDVVTWTGDGAAGKQIAHSLGVAPGMIVVKRTDATVTWGIYHNSLGSTKWLAFDTAAAIGPSANGWNNTDPTATNFTVGINQNTNGGTYVAYLWAHDASADGIVQCGSFTTDASGNATVSLGWEPQFLLVKATTVSGNWVMVDGMRGLVSGAAVTTSDDAILNPNVSNAESTSVVGRPTATGFEFNGNTAFGSTGTNQFIYLAIRRGPMRTPTTGASVYNAVAVSSSADPVTPTAGFPVDLAISSRRDSADSHYVLDRLRGNPYMVTSATSGESSGLTVDFSLQTAVKISGLWPGGSSLINHLFRRAPGFMDVVCYTGTGVARTVAHNLGVAPELVIVKARSTAYDWNVWHKSLIGNANPAMFLSSTAAYNAGSSTDYWNSAIPSSSAISIGTSPASNNSGTTYVAYLFASCPGVSKVFSYTGNGGSQTIACGFAAGARFILLKRVDSASDWFVWDSARGIVASTDPHLSLNTTAAEVITDDSIDPDASGFIVNQVAATNINVNGATYVGLAIA